MPEFQNIDFEKTVLALLVRPEVRKALRLNPSLLVRDCFSDEAAAVVFDAIRELKTLKRPSLKLVISRATFNQPPTRAETVESLVKKIYRREKKLDEGENEAFQFYCEDLSVRRRARLMGEGISQSSEQMLKGNFTGAEATLLTVAKDLEQTTNTISVFRGDVTEDLGRHQRLIKEKIAHPERFAGMLTGIPLYDDATGGLFPK